MLYIVKNNNNYMLNGIFVDKSTGEEIRITNEDAGGFYVLDNGIRIKKEIFSNKYEQSTHIDPTTFFQTPSKDPLLNLANQIKNLDSSKMSDKSDGGTQIKINPLMVLSDNSMSQSPIQSSQPSQDGVTNANMTPEQKRTYLAEWAKTQPGAQIPEIQNRNWEEEEERFLNGDKPIQPRVDIPVIPQVDPIKSMFKMFKNSYPVKINIEIEEKIPSPAFIGIIQENIETDAIEYYANLIADKMLSDPSVLRTQIYDQLKSIIEEG